jgi:hypothetical protein
MLRGVLGDQNSYQFINAGLAQSKGRSGLLWWLVSVFIGPIATFLIVVLPKVEHGPLLP